MPFSFNAGGERFVPKPPRQYVSDSGVAPFRRSPISFNTTKTTSWPASTKLIFVAAVGVWLRFLLTNTFHNAHSPQKSAKNIHTVEMTRPNVPDAAGLVSLLVDAAGFVTDSG